MTYLAWYLVSSLVVLHWMANLTDVEPVPYVIFSIAAWVPGLRELLFGGLTIGWIGHNVNISESAVAATEVFKSKLRQL